MQPLISCYITLSVTTESQPIARLVEALPYKPEGREFDSLWGHWDVSLTYPFSSSIMAMGSAQPLTDMSIRIISWWVKAVDE